VGAVRLEDIDIVISDGDLPDQSLAHAKNAGTVAWDIETSGLDWVRERLATCQLYVQDETVSIVRISDTLPKNLLSLLSEPSVKKVFHHAMFHLRFMHYHWGTISNNIACTKIASKVLDPANEHDHSLKALVDKYLRVVLDKKAQSSDWLAPNLTDEQLLYAAGDVLYLIPLLSRLEEELRARDLLELAHDCYCHIPTRVQLDVLGYGDVYSY
jgi:ribonuclease D